MGDIQQTPFIRELASSDRRTRDKALESLTLFLRSRRDLKLVELLKVWKGLFFCFYHSDRPLTQQSLARSLSYTLLPSLPGPMLQPFLRAFWITMSRDFHSLDRLRLDKYLYLLRCYVGAAFEIFFGKIGSTRYKDGERNKGRTNGRDEASGTTTSTSSSSKKRKRTNDTESHSATSVGTDELETYLSMLEEGPLCPYNFDPNDDNGSSHSRETKMPKGPDGIRYHLMDIWLDEIEKCAAEQTGSKTENGDGEDGGGGDDGDYGEDGGSSQRTALKEGIPMELLLRPIVKMQEKSPNKIARKRAGELLEDERLVEWEVREPKEQDDADDSDNEWAGFD